jgi:phage terminase large subunit GpA-like protein
MSLTSDPNDPRLVFDWCPHCVTSFRIPMGDFTLTIDLDDDSASRLEFACPHCQQHVTKAADDLTRQLWRAWEAPVAIARTSRPPFTADEIIDLLEEMRSA